MKPREQGGVVDAKLNVYGVENLKVAGAYCVRSASPVTDRFVSRSLYPAIERRRGNLLLHD